MILPVDRGSEPIDVIKWAQDYGDSLIVGEEARYFDLLPDPAPTGELGRGDAISFLRKAFPGSRESSMFYLVGPYNKYTHNGVTRSIEENIETARATATDLWNLGTGIFCPHTNTGGMIGIEDIVVPMYVKWVRRMDGLILLPDWEYSVGSRKEVREAYDHKVPVYSLKTALEDQWKPLENIAE